MAGLENKVLEKIILEDYSIILVDASPYFLK